MLKLKLHYFGHLMQRAYSLEKTLRLGKIWRQVEKGTTEVEMVGLYHWLNGREFDQIPGNGEEQGSLFCCSPWGSQRVRHNWMTKQQQVIHKALYLGMEYSGKLTFSLHLWKCFIALICVLFAIWAYPCKHFCFITTWTAACHASLTISMPSNPLILSPFSPSALKFSQYQGLFQWVSCSHQVAKVLELQLQHPSFQSVFRVDFL